MAGFDEVYAKVKAGKYTFADSKPAGQGQEASGSSFDKIYADVKEGKYTFAGSVSPLEEDHLGAYQAKKAGLMSTDPVAENGQKEMLGSSVRDPGAIQSELDMLDFQIKQQEEQDRTAREKRYQEQQSQKPWYEILAGYLGGVQDTTLPTSTVPGTSSPMKISNEMNALLEKRKELQEELEFSTYYQYAILTTNADFAEKSQYKSTKNGRSRSNMDIVAGVYYDDGESGWDDPLYEYINGVKEAGAYLSNKAAAGYGDNAIGRILARMSEGDSESQHMSKDEVAIYNYIRATKGKDAAKEYYLYLQEKLNGAQRKALENKMKKWAQKDPVGSSVFSVLASPLKGISYAGQAVDYLTDGTMEKNAGYNAFSYGTEAIRTGVAEQIEKSGKWGKVGSFAYQTGMSMADFLMNTAISGGNGTLSMLIMGSGAAADTTLAAKDRGLSDGQAFALGTIAGAAEAVTERFSLEALLKPGQSKTAVMYILKNALTEGSEEGASTLINTMADIIISKDKSEWSQSVQAYRDAGKSEEEAFGLALADQAIALGLDVLGGMLSGTVMGIGGAVINHVGAVQTGKDIGKTNPDMAQIQSMIQEGLSNDPSTRSNYVAQQLQQKLLRGEKLTNTDLGKLHQANMQVAEVNRGTNMEAGLKTQDFQAVGNGAVQDVDIQQQAQRLSEVLGREIVLYTEDATENGIHNGYYENGKIYVNTKSDDPFAQIVSHELTHSVEFADAYAELSQVVLGRIAASGTDLNQLRQQKAALYAANNARLQDNSEIDKEIVADYIARQLLTDEKSIVELVREKPNLGRRVLNWLNNLLAKLGNKNAQERAFLSKTRDLYAKALGQSQTSFTEDSRKAAPVAENAGQQVPTNPELAEMLAWMRKEYADGNMTEEEFDSVMDSIMEYEERNNAAEPPEVQHSISTLPDGKKYVRADRQVIFGNDPDSWSTQVEDYINGRIRRGQDVTLIAEDGGAFTITTDTAGKMGDNHNSYGVTLDNDKFYVKANAAVHIDELVQVSHPSHGRTTPDHGGRHGKLANAGWNYRTAYFMDFDGKYYRVQMSIANGEKGAVPYNIGDIEERSFPKVTGSSAKGGALNGETSFEKSVPQPEPAVKRQNSISGNTVRKQDVASDLRAILNRGGGAEELRQYIAEMEQNTTEAYQNTGLAERSAFYADENANEAEQIVKAARNQGIDVEEYLQQNWEQYDVDGQWNEVARRALDMTSGRQYSIGAGQTAQADITAKYQVAVDQILSMQNTQQNHLIIGYTPKIYEALGMPSLPFVIGTGHVYSAAKTEAEAKLEGNYHKNVHYHGLGDNVVKNIYEKLKDPVMILASKDVSPKATPLRSTHSVVAIIDVGSAQKSLLLPIEITAERSIDGVRMDVNALSSAYERDVAPLIKEAIALENTGGVGIYYAKKEALTLPGAGVRFPIRLQQSIASNGIIHRFSEKVNMNIIDATQSQQFKRWFGDWQNNPEAASKVVNADGTPKVVYHGSAEQFTVFSYGHIGSSTGVGILGEGFYFTDKEGLAKGYGENVYPAYLQMKNPYMATTSDAYKLNAKKLQAQNYDGVILQAPNGTVYMVFDNTQIKSATDNVGTYDGNNPDIRYSISGNPETEVAGETEQPEIDGAKLRAEIPGKARDYLKGAERKMLNDLAGKLCVPYSAKREYLMPIVEEISNEYLQNGMVSEQAAKRLFGKAYDLGVVIDTEYYDQYKDIKDHMRTVAVTISDTDKADIADFGDFKKRARGLLRIVNEGGVAVDSYYRELQEMAPELFPDYITHPADQLQKMYKVAGDIRRVEKTLQEYYGKEADAFRRWAQNDFNAAIADFGSELQTVKRYAEEKTAEKETRVPLTPQEAMGVYAQLKDARRNYEKVLAKNLLTEHDEAILGDLLAGKRTLESLVANEDNVKGITAVYEAKRELMQYTQLIAQYKRSLHKAHRDLADQHLETANEWKDKKVGIAYSRETMRRNVQDIVMDSKVAAEVNKTFFEPVAMAEAAATRFKERYREKVRELNLSRKVRKGNTVSEAHAVQLLGEAMDNIAMIERARGRMKTRDGKTLSEWQAVVTDLWKENPGLDRQKIEGAVDAFRKIYDELFVRMNEVRVANGYEPVNYRKGYFPHFQPGESDGILAHFGKAMGISTDVVALPTTINGLTHTFKPGIQWFGNAQERLGFNTAYDAIEGFDKYIEGVASVIHQTENIQRLRALATQIRYRTSDDGLRDQVDQVRAREDLTEEQREALVADIYSKGRFTLSNFVVELDEYTNLLANKKSKLDRIVEGLIGRKWYNLFKWWENRVGANMIAGNISSALTNFIPLTQAGAQLDRGTLVKGMWETLRAIKQSDLLMERSDFITNRRGSDPLIKTWVQKASNVAGKPMELIDSFVSESIVRAAYYQNIKRGMMEEDALHYADIFAANVMADRSRGAMPTLFESHNPLFKAFTQFQLEVNNQFSEVFKDLPRGFKEKSIGALAMVLFKYFLGAWLYNEVFEYFFGRRSALDPIGILNETVGDFVGYELPNLLELMGGAFTGEMPSFETEKVGAGEAVRNLSKNLLSELPFSAGLTLAGIETEGGRIPASSAVPDFDAMGDAIFNTEWSAEKRWKEASDELAKPLTYILPPFGGNQAAKMWKGLQAYFKGGSYSVDSEGNDILQYPVYKDDTKDAIGNLLRAVLMGKNSLPEAQDWVDNGFDSLSAKQTAAYKDMLDAGVNDRAAFLLLDQLQAATKRARNQGENEAAAQREILRMPYVTKEGKAIAYYGLMASEAEREVMDRLEAAGADVGEIVDALMVIKDADASKGIEKLEELFSAGVDIEDASKLQEQMAELEPEEGAVQVSDAQRWRLCVDMSRNPAVQLAALAAYMQPQQYKKAEVACHFDIDLSDYVKLYEIRAEYDANGNKDYSQAEYKAAIDSLHLSKEQSGILWQLATGTKTAKNNPYSKEAGERVLKVLE